MGCFVFRGDQEQARFRFFVEHRVPPRWVWLVRELSWFAVLAVSTTIVLLAWTGPRNLDVLWRMLQTASDAWRQWWMPARQIEFLDVPPVRLLSLGAFVCFAAGQWTSMMIRSGVLAAVAGLALAAVLCGWTI